MRIQYFKRNILLAYDLAERDLRAKYKRALIGSFWILIAPLSLLCIYYLVFAKIFKVSWNAEVYGNTHTQTGFLLPFFVGLFVYLTLSDLVTSSANLFASKRIYILKSSFPIWVLWLSNYIRVGINSAIILLVIIILSTIQRQWSFESVLFTIIGIFLCIVHLAAISIIVSMVGPFIGDINDALRLILRILFYATPITYPLAMIPEPYRQLMWLNPITCMVELLRIPIVFGSSPNLHLIIYFIFLTLCASGLGGWMFVKLKDVVPDVV